MENSYTSEGVPGRYWHALADGRIQCDLCPRECKLHEGQRGLCFVRASVRDLLRRKGTPYDELGLDDPKWTDDELIQFMMQYPILINRPIVVTPKGVKLCRPSEVVLDLLNRDSSRASS